MNPIYRVRIQTVIKENYSNFREFEVLLRGKDIKNNNLILQRITELYSPSTPVQYLDIKNVIIDKKIGEYEG